MCIQYDWLIINKGINTPIFYMLQILYLFYKYHKNYNPKTPIISPKQLTYATNNFKKSV